MVRMIGGVLIGYVFFVLVGSILLYATLAIAGADRLLLTGIPQLSALWLIIILFLTGWVAGVSGNLCVRFADRPEVAIVLGAVIAIQGTMLLPLATDANVDVVHLAQLNKFRWLGYIEVPDWYALSLPLFAAAFTIYGGYVVKK
jgi:hypothetical protein